MVDTRFIKKCISCNKERLVSRGMFYQMKKGVGLKCLSCSQKGNKKNLLKHSEVTKQKMSLSALGKKKSMSHRLSMSKARKGIKTGRVPKSAFKKGTYTEAMRRGTIAGLLKQQKMKEPTSIEKKLYDGLKNRGLLFETQKLINGKFIVDAYIPSLNLIVEADGDYWHNLDRVVKKDKAENAYLTKCGYNILRLSETEINNTNFGERIG